MVKNVKTEITYKKAIVSNMTSGSLDDRCNCGTFLLLQLTFKQETKTQPVFGHVRTFHDICILING